jgi:hypothetical protein
MGKIVQGHEFLLPDTSKCALRGCTNVADKKFHDRWLCNKDYPVYEDEANALQTLLDAEARYLQTRALVRGFWR